MKRLWLLLIVPLLAVGLMGPFNKPTIYAQDNEKVVVDLYFSPTCPHCAKEEVFLDKLEETYGEAIEVNRYISSAQPYNTILYNRLVELDAVQFFGGVPITFVGDDIYFVGFDNDAGRGQQIIQVIDQKLAIINEAKPVEEEITQEEINKQVSLPIIGTIDTDNYSLPMLAIVLGLFDGFNVCSLGALVLILGLVMSLRSRRLIATYGGIFILTTALVYGLLIVIWYNLFSALAPYISSLELLIGLISIGGAIYFFKEFIRINKLGPSCEAGDNRLISKATQKIQHAFEENRNIILLSGAVLSFAAIVAVVEFPCSAAVPVVFAGILADAGVSTFGQAGYIGIFTLFYMLDEIIIFAVSVWRMNIWLTSPKFSKWFAFFEGVILLLLGGQYLISLT